MCNKDERYSLKNYVLWLNDFMKNHNQVDTYSYQYESNILGEDCPYIQYLNEFYFIVENYASKNHIYPEMKPYGEYYNISICDALYKIGYDIGQGSMFYIEKSTNQEEKNYININDVIENKRRPGVENINDKLKNLEDMIISLHEDGIPVEAINLTMRSAYSKIASNVEKENQKTRRK